MRRTRRRRRRDGARKTKTPQGNAGNETLQGLSPLGVVGGLWPGACSAFHFSFMHMCNQEGVCKLAGTLGSEGEGEGKDEL